MALSGQNIFLDFARFAINLGLTMSVWCTLPLCSGLGFGFHALQWFDPVFGPVLDFNLSSRSCPLQFHSWALAFQPLPTPQFGLQYLDFGWSRFRLRCCQCLQLGLTLQLNLDLGISISTHSALFSLLGLCFAPFPHVDSGWYDFSSVP